ncbi:unnamed protein product [Ceutorhynchus assimilis]|uniref:HORMA domain-containing protein n=1 Tax=Ceutorhynchus assimilis TaxID=467358 RepID=A0A9N9MN81_9CUCU|nr:unnamed protein product [Ceutorhynchus assimilis]
MSTTSACIEFPSIIINRLEVQNAIKTFELSKKHLKRVTKLALLNIINRRIQIPDNEFIEKLAFDEVPYFVFKRKSQNRFIIAHHKYGTGVLDALEKGFLRQWDLIIVRKSTREPLESYSFKYKYNFENEGEAGTRDPEKVRAALLHMLDVIKRLPGDKWPESEVDLLCDIFYQENTPTTYEPPHFRPNTELKSLDHYFIHVLPMGRINTGFHKLIGEGRGWNFEPQMMATSTPNPVTTEQEPRDEEEPQPMKMTQDSIEKMPEFMEEEPESLEIESPATKKLQIINNKRSTIDPIVENSSKKAKSLLNESIDGKNPEIASVFSQDLENCVCEWRNLDHTFQLINCSNCSEPVHAVCNGYFYSKAIDKETFICLTCSSINKPNKSRAHLRLVLYGTYYDDREPAVLRNAKKSERRALLNKLETYGIIQPDSIQIDGKALERAIMRNFIDLQNSAHLHP